jgi:hypothetical protein
MPRMIVIAKVVPADSEEAKKIALELNNLNDLNYLLKNADEEQIAKIIKKGAIKIGI